MSKVIKESEDLGNMDNNFGNVIKEIEVYDRYRFQTVHLVEMSLWKQNVRRMLPECKHLGYWERLVKFCLLSMERRMERYKIFYIWKSLNGQVPSLGLSWDGRDGNRLTYPKVIGKPGHARTLQRFSIKWEGVRLFNSNFR